MPLSPCALRGAASSLLPGWGAALLLASLEWPGPVTRVLCHTNHAVVPGVPAALGCRLCWALPAALGCEHTTAAPTPASCVTDMQPPCTGACCSSWTPGCTTCMHLHSWQAAALNEAPEQQHKMPLCQHPHSDNNRGWQGPRVSSVLRYHCTGPLHAWLLASAPQRLTYPCISPIAVVSVFIAAVW